MRQTRAIRWACPGRLDDGCGSVCREAHLKTDASDVCASLKSADLRFMLIDPRDEVALDRGHARGATQVPEPETPTRIPMFSAGTPFVVYCWRPGCNGATRAGLINSGLCYEVCEMIDFVECWAREGYLVDAAGKAPITVMPVSENATNAPNSLAAPTLQEGNRIACDYILECPRLTRAARGLHVVLVTPKS